MQVALKALSRGWNASIDDYRVMDLLSNKEVAMLRFESLKGLKESQKLDLQLLQLAPVLPARCFVAGVVRGVVMKGVCGQQQLWVVELSWSWFLWVLRQARLISREQVKWGICAFGREGMGKERGCC